MTCWHVEHVLLQLSSSSLYVSSPYECSWPSVFLRHRLPLTDIRKSASRVMIMKLLSCHKFRKTKLRGASKRKGEAISNWCTMVQGGLRMMQKLYYVSCCSKINGVNSKEFHCPITIQRLVLWMSISVNNLFWSTNIYAQMLSLFRFFFSVVPSVKMLIMNKNLSGEPPLYV